jgi:hypothetical protein
MRFWVRFSRPSLQSSFQIAAAIAFKPMKIRVHGNRYRTVAKLPLDISGALVGHEHDRSIGVPQIVGVANPKAGGLADSLHQALGLALAERILTTRLLWVFKK